MKLIHSWKVNVNKAIRIQNILREKIVLKNAFSKIQTIGGADVSYSNKETLFGTIVVFSYPDMEPLEDITIKGKAFFPYIPGFLSFREGPILIKAFEKLKTHPELLIFDGQGIAHPRGVGLASHLGLCLNLPTIGCAKTPLLKNFKNPGFSRGDYDMIFREGKVVGAVLRTKENIKPIFVSPGHKIDLETSIQIVLNSCKGFRIPEPLRKAHQISHFISKKYRCNQ
jgi:deoxyribonuclease V